MVHSVSKWIHALFIHMILFHLFKSINANGAYFRLIEGLDNQSNVANSTQHISKEFYQCGREKSCTHVIKLPHGYELINGSEELGKRKHEAVCIYEKSSFLASSCLDFYYNGKRKNGYYEILDRNGAPFTVFCDFESEANSVWTLVASFSLKNKHFHLTQFYQSVQRTENSPNWDDYRLGLSRMKSIRSSSTMWRATCSFPTYKADIYRDYVRAQLKEIDILEYKLAGACRTVDYINIRGHKGWNITSAFWQKALPLHIDSSQKPCQFSALDGSIYDEDNFGLYGTTNLAFRCTEAVTSTTQYWFGGNV